MKLNQVAEVIWSIYQDGRVSATARSYKQQDIVQMVKMTLGNMMRQIYYNNKKLRNGDEYYVSSPLLSIQRFELGPVNNKGMRRADMSEFDLYRLPHNSHIVNVYPVGCSGEDQGKSISQVQPAEENFYLDPQYDFFQFYRVQGRGVNCYHLLPCTKFVDVESTFDSDEVDVSLDVAFDISQQVLGTVLRIPGFASKDVDNPYHAPLMNQLRKQSQQPESTV